MKTTHSSENTAASTMQNTANQEKATHTMSNTQKTSTLYVENGAYLSSLEHAGQTYRLGATTPRFRHQLTNLALNPSAEDFAQLQTQGLWLAPDTKAPKVGIACSGLGAIWPGAGRALYDTFPAAREAMDRLAKVASWDILGFMDETDINVIQQVRWQMPYTYFLEYAQASYLQSLGFAPHISSGHSLGELVAICLSGVYEPEIAWQVFDRRAVYMEGLEKSMEEGTGMMVVYAPEEKILKILELFPELYISNHNTPTQYILSGQKTTLAEAKRALRKDKCPALNLPVAMAFHNPYLHVLRSSALEGLNGLPMKPSTLPIMSNVTAGLYPTDSESIITYMVDLDENTVRWVDCVRNMWNNHGIRHFVELGPADTMCSLITDIEPKAICIPTSLKNNEVNAMRAAVARLYALGHIPTTNMRAVPLNYLDTQEECSADHDETTKPVQPEAAHNAAQPEQALNQADTAPPILPYVQDIINILADATGHNASLLLPHMDLRHELAIRSNRFPAIMHSIEQKFAIRLQFEDVLHVATIQDLANVVAKLSNLTVEKNTAEDLTTTRTQAHIAPCDATAAVPMALACAHLQPASCPHTQETPWLTTPWPTPLCPVTEKQEQTLLIVHTGTQEQAFCALEDLAPLGYTFLFMASSFWQDRLPTLLPSQEYVEKLQSLGAHCRVLTEAAPLAKQCIHWLLHMDLTPEATGPSLHHAQAMTDLYAALMQQNTTIQKALTLYACQQEAQNPLTCQELSPWQLFAAKHSIHWCSLALPCNIVEKEQQKALTPQDATHAISKDELTHFFARHILCNTHAHVYWHRAGTHESTLEENVDFFPQVFPLAFELQDKALFTAQKNFSLYANAAACTEESTVARIPTLSVASMLQSLYAAALFPYPWLRCIGFNHVQFSPMPDAGVYLGPEGVTRESLLQAQRIPSQEAPIRTFHAELAVRAVTANGRRLHTWHTVSEAQCLLTGQRMQPQALWGQAEKDSAQVSPQKTRLEVKKAFTRHNVLDYTWVSVCVEFLLAHMGSVCMQNQKITLESIEQIRHMATCSYKGLPTNIDSLIFEWIIVTQNAHTLTLDAQVTDPQGTLLLTIHNMLITSEKP